MPGFDGTGPNGSGPMSGKGNGNCQGNNNMGPGRGSGRGQGCCRGRGLGRGLGQGFGRRADCPFTQTVNNVSPQDRITALKEYKKQLETEIENLEKNTK